MLKKLFILLFLLPSFALSGCTNSDLASGTADPKKLEISSIEPQPLENETKIRLSSAGNFEFLTAVFVADSLGEFKKENLTIEYVTLPAQEAIPALALGQIDVSAVGITAPFFNAVAEGAEVRLVLPGPSAPSGDGLWLRDDYDLESSNGRLTIGTAQGQAWLGIVPVKRFLDANGIALDNVAFQQLPIGELATALELGSVDASWLNSPAHLPFVSNSVATKVAGYTTSEVGSGYAFGPRLLRENTDIGQAFVRALLRTIQNHLGPGYKENPQVIAALVEKLGFTEEQLATSGELQFETYLDTTLQSRGQELWIGLGGILSYKTPLDPANYLDERFVQSISEK